MIHFQAGGAAAELSSGDLREGLDEALRKLGDRKRVLIVPPDITRLHSRSGDLARFAWDYYGDSIRDILPALGTHEPMSAGEIERMFPGVPASLFRVHDWRGELTTIGTLGSEQVAEASGGEARFEWPIRVNRLLALGGHDLILSIGQVVPHEVMGMAGYAKNLLIGCGGPETIDKSHYLGAVCGMESVMGRADNPVRRLVNRAWSAFASHLPIVYVQTVIARGEDGEPKVRGLFVGDDEETFLRAAELSAAVNISELDEPIRKAVVYLDPDEYRSTWLGNKAIYRLRMAMADGGELLVMAPGLRSFGEAPTLDALIRKYGYRGAPATLRAAAENEDLGSALSAAAHLIHGSSEGRFIVTYCPGRLSAAEMEAVGYRYADLGEAMRAYPLSALSEGWNLMPSGERVFFVSNPAMGLWVCRGKR